MDNEGSRVARIINCCRELGYKAVWLRNGTVRILNGSTLVVEGTVLECFDVLSKLVP